MPCWRPPLRTFSQPEAIEYLNRWDDIEADMAEGGIGSIRYKMEEEEEIRFRELSQWVQEKVAPLDAEWAQMIHTTDESIIVYGDLSIVKAVVAPSSLDAINNKRDELMAENLRFLLNERFEGRKVILIGATYHFLRNNDLLISNTSSPIDFPQATIMWNQLHTEFADQIYTIGFTAGGGSFGEVKIGREEEGKKVSEPYENSLEMALTDLPYEQAFIPLHAADEATDFWDYGPHINLFSYKFGVASQNWPQVIDAVIYVKEMEPVVLKK